MVRSVKYLLRLTNELLIEVWLFKYHKINDLILNMKNIKILKSGLNIYRVRGTRTFGSLKVPDGSFVTNQPSLHPGTIHLLESEPRVRTGTVEPKTPIGTKGLLPNAR